MNITTRIAAQAPPLLCARPVPIPFGGVRKLGFVHQLKQIGRNRKLLINMAWSVGNSEASVESKVGVVRPAEDAFAAEAVGALKAGKVIAVPTDTLYGSACDAWYAI